MVTLMTATDVLCRAKLKLFHGFNLDEVSIMTASLMLLFETSLRSNGLNFDGFSRLQTGTFNLV